MSPPRSAQSTLQPTGHLGASSGNPFTSVTLGETGWVQGLEEEGRPHRREKEERTCQCPGSEIHTRRLPVLARIEKFRLDKCKEGLGFFLGFRQ